MAEFVIGDRQVDTDIRTWEPDLRRAASLVVGAAAGLFLVAALVYYVLNATGSGWFLWVAIAVLAVLLIVEAAVVATGIAREEDVGPAWLAGPQAATAQQAESETAADTTTAGLGAEPEPEPAHEHPEIDLQCPACEQMFVVEDTGQRPLATECPHCGAQGHVNLPEREEPERQTSAPAAGATEDPLADEEEDPLAGLGDEDEPPAEDVETISLSCPACETEFETEDTGERPLKTTCPGCGKSGKLS